MLGKKCISLILSGIIMVSSSVMVSAQAEITVQATQSTGTTMNEGNPNVTKDKAIEIAKKTIKDYFDVNVDDKKFQTSIEYRKDFEINSLNVWQINYNFYDSIISRYYAVTINSDSGKVIAINMNESELRNNTPAVATITYDQAKEAAEEFIKKINPEQAKMVECLENEPFYYSSSYKLPAIYNFRFVSKINGVHFDRNSIDIAINGATGKVNTYSFRWINDIEFPSLEGVVSEEKAMQVFMDEANFTMKYLTERTQNSYNMKPEKAKLVYYPEFVNGYFVEAKNGKLTNLYEANIEEVKTVDLSEQEKEAIIKDLKPIVKQDKEIDSTKATEIMKAKVKELVGNEYEIDQVRYNENDYGWMSNENKIWTAQFYKKDGEIPRYETGGNISINAFNGEIVNLYNYSRYDMEQSIKDGEKKMSWEEAYKKSIDIISKSFPDKFKDIKTLQKYVKNTIMYNSKEIVERTYNFDYPRVVNGIDYPDNRIFITINAITGSIEALNANWFDNINFSSADDVIKPVDAKKIFMDGHKPKLIYILPYLESKDDKSKQEVKLLYSLKTKILKDWSRIAMIDATTGKLLDYDGIVLKEKTNTTIEKLKGHWAEKQLSILAYQGIIDLLEFDTDEEISLMEAIKMIVNAKGYDPYINRDVDQLKFTNIQKDDPDAKYIQMAVKYGVIENTEGEFNKNEPITREKMAMLMVNILKYEKLAEAKEVFNVTYEDVNEIDGSFYGSVAICKGLGILQGSNNLFRPKDTATMAEFGVTVYKTLECMKN